MSTENLCRECFRIGEATLSQSLLRFCQQRLVRSNRSTDEPDESRQQQQARRRDDDLSQQPAVCQARPHRLRHWVEVKVKSVLPGASVRSFSKRDAELYFSGIISFVMLIIGLSFDPG